MPNKKPPKCYKCNKHRAWSGTCIDCHVHLIELSYYLHTNKQLSPLTIHNIRQGYYMEEQSYIPT
jgi:hypothetical protein